MASPQKEDGYTALANEILEAMARTKLSPTQYRLLFVVWRYTYGFQRKETGLSLTFLANATGCDKRQIQRELKDLERRKIIFQNTPKGSTRVIGFNKNYDQWLNDGEATNGETDIGETTNGEIVKATIGETTNPPIGETTNQERNIFKEKYKENIIMLTPDEVAFLEVLETIPNYPFDRTKDVEMYKRLKERYPPLDLLESIKDWREYKADRPLKVRDNPRSQINTTFKKYIEWGRNLKKGGQARAPNQQRNKPVDDWDEEKFYTTRPET
jgi:phage replication O-like protein O